MEKWDFYEKRIPKENRETSIETTIGVFQGMLEKLEQLEKDNRTSERGRAKLKALIGQIKKIKEKWGKEPKEKTSE